MKKSEFIEKSNSLKYELNQLKAESAVRRKDIDKLHQSNIIAEKTRYENDLNSLYADIKERKVQLLNQLTALEVEWAKEEEKSNLV